MGTAEPPEQTAVEPADASTAKSSASAPKPEAPAPVPQPDRRRKRRRRKRAHAEDKSPTPKPQPQLDPTLLDAYEADARDGGGRVDAFLRDLPDEIQQRIDDFHLDWERRGHPTGEPRDELDNNAGSAPGIQP